MPISWILLPSLGMHEQCFFRIKSNKNLASDRWLQITVRWRQVVVLWFIVQIDVATKFALCMKNTTQHVRRAVGFIQLKMKAESQGYFSF